ncbi:MAG: 3'-5' exonuclease [Clostridia bacterium]|nr:3'-5' exonuclease [Clostridia bacterium]
MNYLFFDIECASVFKTTAKICAFGYCLTDEHFNILEKEDILINPQGGFHLTDRKGTQGLVLPYEYAKFKSYPTFPKLADRIYGLLQDENTLVAGHATMNDVKYLNLESKRFSLPPFRFDFADTQFIYMNRVGIFNRQFALGTIAEALGVEFTPHRAADDAYATMRVAEAMCKEEGLSFSELLKKYGITLGRIENYEVRQSTSVGYQNHVKEAQARKERREKARSKFHEFAEKNRRRRNKNGGYRTKTVCFSRSVEEGEDAKALVLAAYAAGFSYIYRPEESHYYISAEGESGQRLNAAASRGACILTPEEFKLLLAQEQPSGV